MGALTETRVIEGSEAGFAAFYAVCVVINWWFYLRQGSEIRNP